MSEEDYGQRSDAEPIGCSAESNQPHVIPLGADNFGSQIAGFGSPVIVAKLQIAAKDLRAHDEVVRSGFKLRCNPAEPAVSQASSVEVLGGRRASPRSQGEPKPAI